MSLDLPSRRSLDGLVKYLPTKSRFPCLAIVLELGARPAQLRWLFVRHALLLAGIGVVIGIGAAVGLTRLMTSLLFEVSPADPLTYTAVPLILMAAAALASYLLARRASAVDPVEALKAE
ncbi:MAG: FtsX-like permease family protein [Acidobacteria bacterium]|nr:FtsX-like permease family protein [Acidobacteriota bacterium]